MNGTKGKRKYSKRPVAMGTGLCFGLSLSAMVYVISQDGMQIFTANMFSSLNLFQSIPCPRLSTCTRSNCFFSHRTDLPTQPPLCLPVASAKRSLPPSQTTPEPPRKLQKLGPLHKPLSNPSASQLNVFSSPCFNLPF